MTRLFRLPVRRSIAGDVDEELAFHLEMRAAELVAQGWTAEAARAEATRQFGDLEEAKRICRGADARREKRQMRTVYTAELRQDVGFAIRSLRRSPGFALVAILTLALGIGANTAIFSVVRGILLRPLSFADPDRLVLVLSSYRGRQFPYTSPANAMDWRTDNHSFTSLSVIGDHSAVLTGAGEPEEVTGADVSDDFFDILGAQPLAGRLRFTTEETAFRGANVVILSETLWRTRFGADRSVVGQSVSLDDERYQVVGVAPARSTYPAAAMVWFPFRYDPAKLAASRAAVYLGVIGRLRPETSLAAANLDMTTLSERLARQFPDANAEMGTAVVPLRQWITGSLDRPLLILFGGVGFVLLIACVNVANLLLARGVARSGELAVRTALGAGRGRLTRQLTTESVVLALAGAAAGLLVGVAGIRFIVTSAPATIPRLDSIRLDGMVLGFTVVVAVLTGLGFGLLPARLATGRDVALTLREGGRSGTHRAGGHRIRRVLVTAELALSVMLLTGAGLLIRSFNRLLAVDPGFRPQGTVSFSLSLPDGRYPIGPRQSDFMAGFLERVRTLPGVEAADAALGLPLTSFRFNFSLAVAGRPAATGSAGQSAEVRVATADYFRTMGMRIARGRGFTSADRSGTPTVLLLNETAARAIFPGEDPIGKHVSFGWGRAGGNLEGDIVGIIADVKQTSLARPTSPEFWAPYSQWPVSSVRVVIRSDRRLESVVADTRRLLREMDPALAISQVKALEQVFSESVAQPRFYMWLLTGFAGVALVLSAIGIYGVIAYLVGQRTREIGIRMALGASRGRVRGMILQEGATLAGVGLVAGTLGAVGLSRVMRTLLFDVSTTDPTTYVGVAVVLAAVALVASLIPAARAARVSPAVTMRSE